MKQILQKLVLRIDAMSLRERVMIFAMSAVVLLALINVTVLDAQFAKQKQLSQKIKQERETIGAIQGEIRQKLMGQQVDLDAPNRARLQQLKDQTGKLQLQLQQVQKGLVSPDRMAVLLEDILRRNGKLRLVSLKTLPVVSLNDPVAPDAKPPADKASTAPQPAGDKNQGGAVVGSVYKHGVEIVVQGGYLDMMNYMTELETMPWQLFWGKAKLNVDEYPKATLTLTLFTLSLDKKWLNL